MLVTEFYDLNHLCWRGGEDNRIRQQRDAAVVITVAQQVGLLGKESLFSQRCLELLKELCGEHAAAKNLCSLDDSQTRLSTAPESLWRNL